MYGGPRPDDHDVGPDFPCGGLRGWLVRAFLVWAWHHTSPIHARVAEASTRKNGTSNAASKEDDMNVHRECSTVQTFARGVCEQPFRMVEGLKGSVNHLVDG